MNKPAIGSAIVIAAVAAVAVAPDASPPRPAQPAQLAPLPVSKDVVLSLAVPERPTFAKERGLLFASPSWAQPQVAPATSKQQAQLSASAGVSAGPVPYRFVGTVMRGNEVAYALAKGDALFWVREGEILDDYRVEAITPGSVTLLYLPSGERTTLALSTPPHNPSVAVRSSTEPQSAPDAPPSVEPRPALRAAQMRGPRTVTQ